MSGAGLIRSVLAAAVLCAGSPLLAGLDEAAVTLLSFDELRGWAEDDHQAALDVFVSTCDLLDDPEWIPICTLAQGQANARIFFELFFLPVLIEDGEDALFTGYYEPELAGSLTRDARFRYPVYRKPPEIEAGMLWHSRAAIERDGVLAGRGLEIAWVDDPVDLQFLQIQGSGRIRLRDGTTIRLGYGGSNGHRYRSLGEELVRRGVYSRHQVSAKVIRSWVRRNPVAGADLLLTNPSYVFFRELGQLPASEGPLGAMNRSLTAGRTLAVDPDFVPLGAPVWLEKAGAAPIARLMVAQDTGSRIKGAQRGDVFYGTGETAGWQAGRVHDSGRMLVLLPVQRAYALSPEG